MDACTMRRCGLVTPLALAALVGAGLPCSSQPARERVAFALLGADGKALGRQVRVHLFDAYGEAEGQKGGISSDGAGVANCERVPCGEYDLWVEPSEEVPGVLFRGVAATPGDGVQTTELRVPPACAVSGRLVMPDGKTPAQGYAVSVQSGTVPAASAAANERSAAYARGALTCYAETEVGADGAFVLKGLTPGKHSLDVRRPGEAEACYTIFGVEANAGRVSEAGTQTLPLKGWERFFDGRTLDGWAESDFWGRKEVRLDHDRVVMYMGNDMTGITWTRAVPRVDYEVSLQAIRLDGHDFFCGLTFPYKDSYCSLILGGWGGSVVGLSSLDGYDASENETSQYIEFKTNRWYGVRLLVTGNRIAAWLDQTKIVDVATENRKIDTRIEVEESKPFGISTWRTTGAARDIRLRELGAAAQ
jgi:3-keto-disaccharide hydrolase